MDFKSLIHIFKIVVKWRLLYFEWHLAHIGIKPVAHYLLSSIFTNRYFETYLRRPSKYLKKFKSRN